MNAFKGRAVQSVTVRAKITRADGTVEDLGVISHSEMPWWKQKLRRLYKWLM